ncbi:hypothetical protein A8C56_09730 [Niabella ginsenosidivorans]|uniref:Hydroxyacid dehydrogenase n=1 Tax=Niabella ginsenosidivorans TaxID=1176587 RepID=A0A1A9I1L5_9BACT|nr:C-terminal binding protein [Niabella ginsenosidivorans]ANH81225.1 hypothetical protein A8C56_09730 [Niabella ginsenosidivorans]
MSKGKIVITDYGFKDLEQELKMFREHGYDLVALETSTEDELIEACTDADALLVQWAPISARLIAHLNKCKIIVRYGIGVDNVDLNAAKQKSIPVCNVPDYCINEVADHTLALALSLSRQLGEINNRLKKGEWKIVPPYRMPAFRDMLFGTIGFGRIAREVLKSAKSLGFKVGAYDPKINPFQLKEAGVAALSFEELISGADIISLHLPLTAETQHIINAATIEQMKQGAIIINTSRGGLIDTEALAAALSKRRVVAGLDVFENEPLPETHPLWGVEHAVLTSHTAWYSERSVPALQQMAAAEVLRGLQSEPLKNRVI